MKLFITRRKGFVPAHIVYIKRRMTEIDRQIRKLEKFVANPRLRKKKDEVTIARLLGPTILPESKKRFVSYLSTGSFQTIALRRHEQRAAKIKGGLLILLVILAAFFLIYTFIAPFMH
ncbi:MAG: hypothetical protein NTZ78_02410 [Candidatus Aureabacteria bacterium]|nr:hypothetical protein [Candidatus Auribacterota bacterium]